MFPSDDRQLLTAAARSKRERDEDLDDPLREPEIAPGKLTNADMTDASVSSRTRQLASPGKLRRDEVEGHVMSPADALRYAEWLQKPIDRRANDGPDLDDENGALATAFNFLESAAGGVPLPPVLLARLTEELRVDLTAVRIHTDERAGHAAAALNARAFTIGNDIYFATGAYDPVGDEGVQLIAHEVAHVAQQRSSNASTTPKRVSRASDAHEQDAEGFARRFSRTGRSDSKDPADLVNRARRDGNRISLPFLPELEERLGMPLDFVEAYTGEAARAACQLMAAGAFAVSNIVAFADDSPQKELLLHELAHVAQMGSRSAPAKFESGSLRVGERDAAAEHDARSVVAGASIGVSAPADVIHRGDPDEKTQEWTIDEAKTRFRAYARSAKLPKRKKGERHVFGKLDNEAVHFLNTSSKPFTLSDYKAAVQAMAKYKKLSDADLEKDLKEIHKEGSGEGLVQVGEAGKRWGYIDPAENPPTNVAYLLETVYERKDISEYYQVYCEALAELKHLTAKPTVKFKDQADCVFKVDEEGQPTSEGELKKCRKALEDAIVGEKNYKLNAKKGEWDKYFSDVVESKKRFPQKMVGDWFEIIAGRDMAEKLGGKKVHVGNVVFPSDHPDLTNDTEHVADGLVLEGAGLKRTGIMEAKTGPSSPELAQAAAYATILKEGIKAVDVPATKRLGPFTKCTYVFTTKKLAEKWIPGLKAAFKAKGQLSKLVVVPDPDAKGFAALTFNPTFQVPLDKPEGTHHHLTSPKISHPGMNFTSMDLVTKEANSDEVVSGSVTFDMNLAGGVEGKKITKQVKAGAVENKFDGLKTSLDKILKRVKPSAKLTEEGVEGTLEITPGASGIPKINLEESKVTVKYNASGQLTAEGEIGLAHTSGKIKGKVKVGWDGANWNFLGSATVSAGMVEGLSEFTAHVKYEGGHWSFGVDKVAYTKKFKAIELTGSAFGVEYDIDKGHFSGLLQLEADLGMFGKATATAELKENKLKKAELSYDSPELKYPAKKEPPTFVGTIGGTVTYENEKFSGSMRGTANLNVPALKKIAGEAGIGLAVDATISGEGKYSGSIKTLTPLKFGKHLEIPSIGCEIKEDGSVTGDFSIKVKEIKYLKDASIDCKIDKDGFHVTKADVHAEFGKEGDKMWGGIAVKYEEGKGLKIGGTLNVKIKEGMIAKGTLEYSTETNTLTTKLGIDEITLFDKTISKSLFKFSKQIPLVSFYNIIGIYLDIGFDLDFDFGMKLGLRPTITLEELSLDTFEYKQLSAEIELLGQLRAALTATPKVGLGIFAISPSLLRGGGGIKIPITGEALLKPTGKLKVAYSPSGGITGDATVGMQLTFGIKGSVKPYAEAAILDGAWNPSWTGDSLADFEILPPKELLNFNLDLGKDKQEEPAIPSAPQAPSAAAGGKQIAQEAPKTSEAGGTGPGKDATPPAQGPAGGGEADDSVLKMGSLTGMLKGLPGYATISGFMEKAAAVWEKIKGFFGRVAKAFKSFFESIGNAIEEVLNGFANEGLGYLPKLIKKIVGDTVWNVIEPIVNAVAKSADAILELFETDPPSGLSDFFPWALKLMKKAFGVAFTSISALVSAIRTMISRLSDLATKIVTQMVNEGMVGVKRHAYYVWNPVGPNYNFLAATEYKINVLGVSLYFREEGMITSPGSVVGIALFEILESMGVPSTNDYYDSDSGDTYRDRWV